MEGWLPFHPSILFNNLQPFAQSCLSSSIDVDAGEKVPVMDWAHSVDLESR